MRNSAVQVPPWPPQLPCNSVASKFTCTLAYHSQRMHNLGSSGQGCARTDGCGSSGPVQRRGGADGPDRGARTHEADLPQATMHVSLGTQSRGGPKQMTGCICMMVYMCVYLHTRTCVTRGKRQRPGVAKNDDSNGTNTAADIPTVQPPNSQRTKLEAIHLSKRMCMVGSCHGHRSSTGGVTQRQRPSGS